MRGDPAHDTAGAQCKVRATLRGRAGDRHPMRGAITHDTVIRRSNERYRLAQDANNAHCLRGVVTNDTVTRTSNKRYLLVNLKGYTLPAGHEQGSQGSTCKSFPSSHPRGRYPWSGCHCGNQGRGDITNDTVMSHSYWRYSKSTRQVLSSQKEDNKEVRRMNVNPLLHTRSLEGIVNSLVTGPAGESDGPLVKSITRGALSSSSIRTCRVKYTA